MVWYRLNARKLPWRKSKNPYKIWLSEIILQQTRVDQGLSYYMKFSKQYPNIEALAKASEHEVLKLWQGLGYYSRARNLHATAKYIFFNKKGKFSTSYNDLIKLKGIGVYTAAAIASICSAEPVAAIDGNYYRLLSRFFGVKTAFDTTAGKKEFKELAQLLITGYDSGIFNQAVMDFASLVCKPKNPLCNQCILQYSCFANQKSLQNVLPVKSKQTIVKKICFDYYLITDGKKCFMRKRTAGNLWNGLYELVLFENRNTGLKKFVQKNTFKEVQIFKTEHLLSHRKINANFYLVKLKKLNKVKDYVLVDFQQVKNYPVSRLTEKFFMSEAFLQLSNK